MRLIIINEQVRRRGIELLRDLPLDPVHEITIKVHKKSRTTMQNSKLWAMLTDISQQVEWHGRKLTKENWKDIFSASLKKQDVCPGLDNNFVVLGTSTSHMSIAEMAELIELMTAFGCQHGVQWKEVFYQE